jgi:hypothetical protein
MPLNSLSVPWFCSMRKDLTSLAVRFWLLPRFPSYFIVYAPAAKPPEVIRILHRARNISSIVPQAREKQITRSAKPSGAQTLLGLIEPGDVEVSQDLSLRWG